MDVSNCCENCKFYWHLDNDGAEDVDDAETVPLTGECRFNPPRFISEEDDFIGHWPMVNIEDWCGKFQPEEEESHGLN